MKRILSLILTLCIIGSCFTFSVVNAADEETVLYTPQEQSAFEFLSAIEIMVGDDKGNANLEKNMTRAEFAQLIKNILSYIGGESESEGGGFFDESIWQDSFFGSEDNSDQLMTDTSSSSNVVVETVKVAEFEDVDTAHWAYDAINYVRDLGIMNGTSATTFNPDGEVRTNEVIKTIMVMLGYKALAEVTGGYPTGYLKFAQRINLANGTKGGEYCTRGDIAVILKNAMSKQMLIEASYGESGDINFKYDENRTFASDILGLHKIEGIMSDNGYTSIIGASAYEGDKIVVANNEFRVAEGKEFSKFIGRDVDCWFTNYKSNDSGIAVYVELNGRDKVTEIDIETLTNSTSEVLNYKVNKVAKKVNYEGAYIIHNSVALNTYSEDLFNDFITNNAYGKITVIETNSALYKKIVVIDEFETWVTGNVDALNTKIYNVLREGEYVSENDIIELDFEDPKYIINIYDAEGNKTDFTAIQKNSVLDVIRRGNVFAIYVTNRVVTDFKIAQVTEDKGRTYISDGENEFEVTSAFMNYDLRDDLVLNKTFTIYLNSFGRVAWAVSQEKAGLQVGYILEIGNRGSSFTSREIGIQMYTIGGMHTLFDVAENVRVSDHNGDELKMTEKEFYDTYAAEFNAETNILDGICRYTVDDEDAINYIELPILDPDTKINGKLHLILSNDDPASDKGYYRQNSNSLGGHVAAPTSAKTIKVDSAKRRIDDENAFSVGAMNTIPYKDSDDSEYYTLRAYSDVEGALSAKYVVVNLPSGATGMSTEATVPDMYIITSVGGGRFPDDTLGTVYKAKKYKQGAISDANLYIKDDAVFDTEAETDVRVNSSNTSLGWVKVPFTDPIEVGDVVRVAMDENGLVEHVRVVFDENGVDSTGNPQTPGVIPGMNRWSAPAASHPQYNNNPFAYGGGTAMNLASGRGFSSGSFRIFQCYPLKIRDGVVKLTGWDVIQNGYPEVLDSNYKDEVWSTSKIVVVNFVDGDITVKTGSVNDIKTYEDFGADCSRVVFNSRFANIPNMIIYNSNSWDN